MFFLISSESQPLHETTRFFNSLLGRPDAIAGPSCEAPERVAADPSAPDAPLIHLLRMRHNALVAEMTHKHDIRDDPEAPAAARVQAARDILDRTLGRPRQRVETSAWVTTEDPVAEVARLEAEVKRLKEGGVKARLALRP